MWGGGYFSEHRTSEQDSPPAVTVRTRERTHTVVPTAACMIMRIAFDKIGGVPTYGVIEVLQARPSAACWVWGLNRVVVTECFGRELGGGGVRERGPRLGPLALLQYVRGGGVHCCWWRSLIGDAQLAYLSACNDNRRYVRCRCYTNRDRQASSCDLSHIFKMPTAIFNHTSLLLQLAFADAGSTCFPLCFYESHCSEWVIRHRRHRSVTTHQWMHA